jgi:prolyl oligopeptidase
MLYTAEGTGIETLVSYADLKDPKNAELKGRIEFKPLIKDWIGSFNYIQNEGTKFFFSTTYNAPRGKVISIDLENPSKDKWIDVISEPENRVVVDSSKLLNNFTLVQVYLKDVAHQASAW